MADAVLDTAPLERWLTGEAAMAPPVDFDQIAGGRSNLTFVVTDASGRRVVLRRPPLGELLATAHDVVREARIIAALGPTAVPVPAVVGATSDPEQGGPFFVMEHVEGLVVRTRADAEQLPDATRAGAGEALVTALAELHRCDLDAVGLGDLSRRSGYIERQLRRWRAQLDHADAPPALLFEVHEQLVRRLPDAGIEALTHGDFRIDNCILGPGGEVRAVLDWELATIGDPLADLALLLVYWRQPDDPALDETTLGSPTAVAGFATRDELIARYVDLTGASVDRLPLYLAFAAWRLACILQGVFDRQDAGALGDAGGELASREPVAVFAEEAAAHLRSS
jgi:aminoglycoside phosphotransferase (APT) family kinase protein